MTKIAMKAALLLLLLITFAACDKKADNDPTPVPDENEELVIVLDAFTGLYNVHITEVERDATGQIVATTESDTIVVLSRINENTMEFLQYTAVFLRQDNLSDIYDIRTYFVLNNPDNTDQNYQRLTIYRDGSRHITFTEYLTLLNGHSITRTYEGILQ